MGPSAFRGALVLLLVACMAAPAHAISDAQLDRLSREEAARQVRRYGLVHDAAMNARVRSIFERVARASRPTRWSLGVEILNNQEVNAFALPNGMVFVDRGVLDLGLSDDELAFVLGHEIGHVTLQHARKEMQNAENTGAVIGIVAVILGGRNNGLIRLAAGALDRAITSGYSRQAETQADQQGLESMSRAGYDPHAVLRFFERLRKVEKSSGVRLFPSHPLTSDRERNARRWLAEHPQYADRGPRPTPAPPASAPLPSPTPAPPVSARRPRSPAPRPRVAVARDSAPLAPGDEAPDLTLANARGDLWHLARHRGRTPLVLCLWDARFPASAFALATLNRLARDLGSGSEVVAVHSVGDAAARKDALREARQEGVSFPVLFDDGRAAAVYGVPGAVPQTILIDARGRVRLRVVAFPDPARLRAEIERMADPEAMLPWATGSQSDLSAGDPKGLLRLEAEAPPAPEVVLNGEKRGRLPLEVHLSAGRYFVQLLRPEGGTAFTVTVTAGKRLDLHLPAP